MIAISVWGASVIPAAARVPIHFDLHGRADGFGSRWLALLVLPLVAAVGVGAVALGRRWHRALRW